MNKSLVVLINSVKKVKDFVQKAESFDCDIDAIEGRYVINSKSIMGILSLDILSPIRIEILTDNEEEIKRFNELMQEFLLEE